ncbi:hypothetical protein [Xenorhabdus bovienii]|uniref:hypothetical protein n=1 Tax=Xenorhabdus bovienii TaxID=40576 RepID=UPI002157C1F9|nr:hypothetical protein [Xenorhabdus bovienii]
MSKDVIEKINTTLESAEEFKSEGVSTIILDLDVYITILKRLAKYENMEPVAWQFEWLDVPAGHWRFNISEYKSDIDSIKYRVRNIIPLYRHPNK